ncbi:MAG: PIN domain-containing protein [Sphingomonadaceae bacterium]
MRFVDTNVLIYAAGLHPEQPRKTQRAREVLASGDVLTSAQVIAEFFDRSVRKSKPVHLTDRQARLFVDTLRAFHIAPVTIATFDRAMRIREQTNYRYYDCAVIASALLLNTEVLLTEDLQKERVIEGLRIENPFSGL